MNNDKYLIKLVTYNIHSGKNYWMKPTLNEIIKYLKRENPDIILVQEVNESKKRGFQVSQIQKELNYNFHFGANVKKTNLNYGIATFSSFPIIEKKHIFLPSKIEQRGLIHTIIQIKDKKLSILNTHLGLSSKERTNQFKVINKYLESIEQPYILAGDLNTANPQLNSNYLIDTGKEMNKENLSTFMILNKRIDYIFTSKDIEVLKYDVYPVYMSDHYPVFSQLKL